MASLNILRYGKPRKMRTMRKYIRKNGNGHTNKNESMSYINESQLSVF
jgi:hypothetical protein